MSRKACLLFIFISLLFFISSAEAACSVNATSMNFGSYDVLSTSPLDSTSNISVTCDARAWFISATIGTSLHSGGFDPRQMKLLTGSDLLDYNLYTNAPRNTIWGDGSGGTGFRFFITIGPNQTRNRTVYGRIPPGQDVSGGPYTDTLVATITY